MGLITNIKTGLKLKNSYLLLVVINNIKNWHEYFLDFLSLTTKRFITYYLQSGPKLFVRAKTCDRGIMTAVCLADEYQINELILPKESVVVDIGANIGTFTVHVSKKAGKIIAFEPILDNFKMLIENIKINNLEEKVIPFNLAVTDKKQKLLIFLSKHSPGQHSIYGFGGRREEVTSITLQAIFDENNIDRCELLKIDTEGSEYDILYGLPDEYFKRIKRIRLEHHDMQRLGSKDVDGEHNPGALEAFLDQKGFNVRQSLDCFFAERKSPSSISKRISLGAKEIGGFQSGLSKSG